MNNLLRPISPEHIRERNAFFVLAINGGVTASSLGRRYHLSRERVCQIYYKITGKSVRQLREEVYIQKMKEKIDKKPRCKTCGNKIILPKRRVFCSTTCHNYNSAHRRDAVERTCSFCRIKFRPYSTAKFKKPKHEIMNHFFCKQEHYLAWRKTVMTEYEKKKKERNERIIALAKNGVDVRKIAETTGFKENTIRHILYQAHVGSADIVIARLKKLEK